MRRTACFLAVLCAVAGLSAPVVADDLDRGVTARVIEVVDGDTVVLEGGDQVRLAGIQAPKLPPARPALRTLTVP